ATTTDSTTTGTTVDDSAALTTTISVLTTMRPILTTATTMGNKMETNSATTTTEAVDVDVADTRLVSAALCSRQTPATQRLEPKLTNPPTQALPVLSRTQTLPL